MNNNQEDYMFNQAKTFIKKFTNKQFTYVSTFLIKSNIDMNHKDIYGNTLLHYACREKKFNVVRFLLKNGSDPDIINNDSRLPLHFLAIYGNGINNNDKKIVVDNKNKAFGLIFNHLISFSQKSLYEKDMHGKSPLDYYVVHSRVTNLNISPNLSKIVKSTTIRENIKYKIETYIMLRQSKKYTRYK